MQTSTKDDRLVSSPLGVWGTESSFEDGVSSTFDWLVWLDTWTGVLGVVGTGNL